MADGHSTIGAGDTFIAGVLFGLLCHFADWDAENMLRFAVDLATQKVQMDGFAGLAASAMNPRGN
jgi:ketohexokinase